MSNYDKRVGELSSLVGGKITHLIHTPPDEECNVYWGFQITVKVDGKVVKKVLWILADFEDNGPGAWDIEEVAQ